jgi:hypothetical protein
MGTCLPENVPAAAGAGAAAALALVLAGAVSALFTDAVLSAVFFTVSECVSVLPHASELNKIDVRTRYLYIAFCQSLGFMQSNGIKLLPATL